MMNRRTGVNVKVIRGEDGFRIATVYFNRLLEEFVVGFQVAGKSCGEDSDYFTDDWDDAIGTANLFVFGHVNGSQA